MSKLRLRWLLFHTGAAFQVNRHAPTTAQLPVTALILSACEEVCVMSLVRMDLRAVQYAVNVPCEPGRGNLARQGSQDGCCQT